MIDEDQVEYQLKLSNKNSNKLRGDALRQYKQTITLNPIQREVIVGTLLGDASMPLKKGKPTFNVRFAQNLARAEYVQHLYEIFENFVGTPPRVQKIRGGGAPDRKQMRFQTYSHSEFKFYDEIFYPVHEYKAGFARLVRSTRVYAGTKEWLKIFTNYSPQGRYPIGSWTTDRAIPKTKSAIMFLIRRGPLKPFEDQQRLADTLRYNFSIAATIQKQRSQYVLYIRSKSTNRFVDLINPYLHPCFSYKIQNN